MRYARFLGKLALHFLKVLAYQWIFDLGDLLKRFLEGLRKLRAFLKMPHPEREEAGRDCTIIDNPSFHRPDPCIYSQSYLKDLGLAVTWDNPDIAVRRNGVLINEADILADTDHEIEATVWNNSYEAPAVGLSVAFSFLSFGVTKTETPIATTYVNLGVKGGADHPALVRMPWHAPPTPGHYCLKVALGWLDDSNPANNIGYNNIKVVAPHSPAEFTFRLQNDTDRERQYRFEVDSYSIPQLPECKAHIERSERGPFRERVARILKVHGSDLFPVPAGWTVDISPEAPALPPQAEIDVTVQITPPSGFTGRQPFNVNAIHDGGFAGGVTLIVRSN